MFIPVDRFACFAPPAVEKSRDYLWICHSIEFLPERDPPAAVFLSVAVPVIPMKGNAVVAGKPLLKSRVQQLLALPEQELLQVNPTGSLFLFVCEMDV